MFGVPQWAKDMLAIIEKLTGIARNQNLRLKSLEARVAQLEGRK